MLESFKSAFVHALSLTLPPAVCEYCPYNHIQKLCKSLEGRLVYMSRGVLTTPTSAGVSTQVAQSKIQECLSSFSEAEYNQIMQKYKVSFL